MKYYFNTVKKCSDELKTHLELITKVDNVEVDIYEVMACYLTDVLGIYLETRRVITKI